MQGSASKPGQGMMVYHIWETFEPEIPLKTKYPPRGLREYDACRGPVDQAWRAETAKGDGMCWKNVRLHQRAMESIWPITYYRNRHLWLFYDSNFICPENRERENG